MQINALTCLRTYMDKKQMQIIINSFILILTINSFMTEVPIIQKAVHCFALQINGLISI